MEFGRYTTFINSVFCWVTVLGVSKLPPVKVNLLFILAYMP